MGSSTMLLFRREVQPNMYGTAVAVAAGRMAA